MDFEQLKGLLSAQPDEAEQRMAKMQGLLGLGIGLLSGSRGNYGAFAPALAQGLQGGMQGYMGAQQLGAQNRRGKAQEAIALANLQSQMSGNKIREQEAAERAQDRQRRLTWQESVDRAMRPPAPMPMPVAGSMGGLDSYDPPNAAPTPAPQMTPAMLRQLGIQGIGMGGETLLSQAERMEAQNRPQTITVTERTPDGGSRQVLRQVAPGQADGMVVGEAPAGPAPTRTTNRGIEEFRDGKWTPTGLQPYRAPTQGPAPQYAVVPDPRNPGQFMYDVVRPGLQAAPPSKGAGAGNPTEAELKAAALGSRLNVALQSLDSAGVADPKAVRPGLGTTITNLLPEPLANAVRTPQRQVVEDAQLDAIDAALTLTTGAAYTREQLVGMRRSFFPQPGDNEATLADKRIRFNALLESARTMAGRAAPGMSPVIDSAAAARLPRPGAIGQAPADAAAAPGDRASVLRRYGL